MLAKHMQRFNKPDNGMELERGTEKWMNEQVREGSIDRRESSPLNEHCSQMSINLLNHYWA